jgi:hypothetical protein
MAKKERRHESGPQARRHAQAFLMQGMTCQRCSGSGWVCETHPDQPMDHTLASGKRCPGPFEPCPEPGCLDRGTLKGWTSLVSDLDDELDELSRRVLQTFGTDAYDAAIIRAAAVAKQRPGDPRSWNIALRDERRRLVRPH